MRNRNHQKNEVVKDEIQKLVKRLLEKWVEGEFATAYVVPQHDQVPIAVQPHPEAVQPTPQADDIPHQIKQLAELRDSGAITDEEIAWKKAELLDRI